MKAKRRGGVRIIVPPAACAAPTRVTCRAATRRAPAAAPPPLMEGEALASRLLELQPQGAKFLAPVIIEVPIFTSSCREREIVILRSDTGETWQDHYLHNNDNAMIQNTPPPSPVLALPDDEPQYLRSAFYQQDAQDLNVFLEATSHFEPENTRTEPFIKKLKKHRKKRCYLKHFHNQQHSFVLKSAPKKGRYLIKIQIVDLEASVPCDSDEDNTMVRAQYVVEDHVDGIMDQTECLISNISKKLCGYSYNSF